MLCLITASLVHILVTSFSFTSKSLFSQSRKSSALSVWGSHRDSSGVWWSCTECTGLVRICPSCEQHIVLSPWYSLCVWTRPDTWKRFIIMYCALHFHAMIWCFKSCLVYSTCVCVRIYHDIIVWAAALVNVIHLSQKVAFAFYNIFVMLYYSEWK